MASRIGAMSAVLALAGCDAVWGLRSFALDARSSDAAAHVRDTSDPPDASDSGVPLPKSCRDILQANPGATSGMYSIDPGVTVSCDMTNDGGGWTLVGKVDGRYAMSGTWLISNVGSLASPTIAAGEYACIDAVALAVNESTEVRLSSSDVSNWVKWPLPTGRDVATWWRHSITQAQIAADAPTTVTVTTSGGATRTCYQDRTGINPRPEHGGSYPYTSYNAAGNTQGGDWCMGVGTILVNSNVDGFGQNGNGYDAPSNETGWPNGGINVPAHVAVWLR